MIKHCKKSLTFILLLLIGLSTIVEVNARSSTRKREKFGKVKKHLKSENVVEEKFRTLLGMRKVNVVIPLPSSEFRDLIIKSPKNYSAIVVITDEEMKCQDCDEALKELTILAQSYSSMNFNSNSNTELFFIRLEYYDASAVLYDQIKLYRSTPYILYFPTDSNAENIQGMDLRKYSLSAEGIATWIRDFSGIIIRPSPKKHGSSYSSTFMILFSLLFIVIQRWNTFKSFLVLDSIPILLVGIVIIFLSGQVYNHVHVAAFALRGSSGGLVIIHPGTHSQTILESFLIFILISTSVFGLIMLIESAIEKGKKKSLALDVPVNSNAASQNTAEGNNGGETIGAVCFLGAVYGLITMSSFKMS